MVCLRRTYLFKFFKGSLLQNLLSPLLNTLFHIPPAWNFVNRNEWFNLKPKVFWFFWYSDGWNENSVVTKNIEKFPYKNALIKAGYKNK